MYKAGKWFEALFDDEQERGQVIWLDRLVPPRGSRQPQRPLPAGDGGRLVPFATFVARAQARRRVRKPR